MLSLRQFSLALLVSASLTAAAPAARAQVAGPQDSWFRHVLSQDVRVLRTEADANNSLDVDPNDREADSQGETLTFVLIGVCLAGVAGMLFVTYSGSLKAGQPSD